MEKRIKGAIWSHFFREYPEATSLCVEDIQIESDRNGSAVLRLQRGTLRDLIQINWEMDDRGFVIRSHGLIAG